MLKVWAGLEARSFLQASIETAGGIHGFDDIFADRYRLNDASNMTNYPPISNQVPSTLTLYKIFMSSILIGSGTIQLSSREVYIRFIFSSMRQCA